MKPWKSGILRFFIAILGFCFLFFAVAAIIGPGLSSTGFNMGRVQKESAPIIAAIEHYRSAHGALPISLEELVPQYLPELKEITYSRRRYYSWPHKLFDGPVQSEWVYKTSHDKTNYALAVRARTFIYYDSQTADWTSMPEVSYVDYDKPITPPTPPTL